MTDATVTCWACKGKGTYEHASSRGNGYKLRYSTRRCLHCKGSGSLAVVEPKPEPQEIGEIPDWMLE